MDRKYKRISCGRLYDGVTEEWKENWQILAEGDKIAAVGAAFNAAVAKIDKMTASYDKQAAAIKNLILAQIELEKQRNIAGGMSTEEASAIIQKGLTLLFQ